MLLIEIGESQVKFLVYVALLQDDRILSKDFMQKNEVQLNFIKGEFYVGARLTKKHMCKAYSPLAQYFSVRRVRLPPFSEGCSIVKLLTRCLTFFEPTDEFPVGLIPSRPFNNSGRRCKRDVRRVLPKYPHTLRGYSTTSGSNVPLDVCDEAVRLITQYSDNHHYTAGSENSIYALFL